MIKKPEIRPSAGKVAVRPVTTASDKAAPNLVREFTVAEDDDDIRLDRWFKRNLPEISFNLISRWARTGQIRVDAKRAAPGDHIAVGQIIRVPPLDMEGDADDRPARAKARAPLSPETVEFAQSLVIHRDAHAIVINKPPGLATQGGTKMTEHVDGLLDALTFGLKDRPKLVHRLDKDTSGALLLARSARAAGQFSKAFSSRTARKVYWALVMGVPDIADGVIELPLSKQPGTGGEKMHVDEENGMSAKSRYRVIERAGNRACWVELQPFTGRTHQLRVHMAAIGHPIVGDGKYGGKDAFLTGAISRKMHLHARRIRIDHPSGNPLDVRAELPVHMEHSFTDLGFDMSLGDMMAVDQPKYKDTPEAKRRLAANIAKSARKERKGERRARGAKVEPPRGGKPVSKKDAAAKTGKAPARKKGPASRGGPKARVRK